MIFQRKNVLTDPYTLSTVVSHGFVLIGLAGEGRKEGRVPCPGQPELAYKGEKFSSRGPMDVVNLSLSLSHTVQVVCRQFHYRDIEKYQE